MENVSINQLKNIISSLNNKFEDRFLNIEKSLANRENRNYENFSKTYTLDKNTKDEFIKMKDDLKRAIFLLNEQSKDISILKSKDKENSFPIINKIEEKLFDLEEKYNILEKEFEKLKNKHNILQEKYNKSTSSHIGARKVIMKKDSSFEELFKKLTS